MKRQHATHDKLDQDKESFGSPSEFMRSRHPDLFSDSTIISLVTLPREVFEYHLDTLTNRKQEIEFEHFCRRLAEKELCPNLIPQTGPVGGGDSQVDTETYPVADQIALRWYEGIGREASNEHWAFAFSAKKAWRSKANSDIEKIVNTNRGYKHAFFITSQFVRDRTRAQVEESLENKFGIPVRIFDRSWIVKCVFEHDRLDLATETLKIPGFTQAVTKQIGPNDTRRKAELKELEEQINDPERYHGVEYQLAEDCLDAALIARGLELSRVEVEGRFQRAVQIAARVGIRRQKLRIIYYQAWTEYWWYEDYGLFNQLYNQVETLVIGSSQADDVEYLVNLWQILHTAIKNGLINETDGGLPKRTQTVKAELEKLEGDERRPNNALQARTNHLLINLTETLEKNESIDPILDELKDVLHKSEGLSEYPVTPIIKIIQELGDILTDSPKYDDLLEVVIKVAERRNSEGKAGQILLERGIQKYRSGKNYDVIKLIGRAQQKLAKDEYKSEWITSLVICGLAYEAVGLLWAARANILMATSQAFSEYTKGEKLKPPMLRYIQKLIWLELQLGRLPQILSWLEFSTLIANLMVLDDVQNENYQNERNQQDQVLAILLLKTDFWNLKWLDFLPPVLDERGLFHAWMTLLYALGYEDYLREEKMIPEEETSETVRELFNRLYNQPASKDIPDHPEFLNTSTVNLYSPVLGCNVVISATNDKATLFLAENIVGALEAFLATSFDSDIMPYRSELNINIRKNDYLTGLPVYIINENKQGEIEVRCPAIIPKSNSKERSDFRDWLQTIILEIVFQLAVIPDANSFIDNVVKNERGFDRAIMFSDVEIAISNLLGENPKINLSDWKRDETTEKYPLIRDVPLNFSINSSKETNREKPLFKPGEGDPPSSLFNMDMLGHKDRKVVSLINVPLWDKAKWRGIGYVCSEGVAPILALGFTNPEPAKQIFEEWCDLLGEVDEKNRLRIAIITGVNKKYPLNYRVLVTTNAENFDLSDHNHYLFPARFIEMFPETSQHLDYFLEEYKKTERFVLAPAILNAEKNYPVPLGKLVLGKYQLVVRPAWQIGLNDPDIFIIKIGDIPIIPDGITDPPVLQALQRFARRNRRRRK